jgi:hypothetical protein
MAVELRNALAESLGRPLPATLLFKYPTLEGLGAFVVAQLPEGAVGDAAPQAAARPSDTDAREVEAMSDAEARALLSSELEAIAAWTDITQV